MTDLTARDLADLAADEGLVTKAYRCPAGVWTIGVGHTSAAGAPKVTKGMVITREEALRILAVDVPKYEKRVKKRMGPVPQNVLAGSTQYDFNTGAIDKASWVKLFLSGSLAAAEKSFKSWNKGGGKVLKGLVRRRTTEWAKISRKGGAIVAVDETQAHSTTKEEIESYQAALKTLGYYKGEADGDAGELTIGAVKSFQRANGLVVDGKVGPATRATLSRALDAKAANTNSAAGGAVTGTGTASVEVTDSVVNAPPSININATGVDPTVVAVAQDINLWLILGIAVGTAALIWGGYWLWRNRGRFTGKRVAT